jgi:IclR family transcriptional regulator, blcABC operon repressor
LSNLIYPESSPAPAVTRSAALLDELAKPGSGPLGLSDLARRLDLPKSSIANLCVALEEAGLIRRIDGRYSLGHKLVELASAYLSKVDLLREFHDRARMLPTASHETMLFAILDDLEVLYLARHDGTQPVRLASDVGRKMPATCTALGKAMLASLPAEMIDDRLAALGPLPKLTSKSNASGREVLEDVKRTRVRGYSIDDEENTEGIMCFSVALPWAGGAHAPRAVSVTLLKARVTKRLRADLIADLHDLVAAMPKRLDLDIAN